MRKNLEEVFAIVRVLDESRVRDLDPNVTGYRYKAAQWLADLVGLSGVRLLWLYAKAVGDSPTNLFAYWLKVPSRVEAKVAEALAKPDFVRKAQEHMRIEDAPGKAAPIHKFRRLG